MMDFGSLFGLMIDIGPKLFFCNTQANANDLKVKVTHFEILHKSFMLKFLFSEPNEFIFCTLTDTGPAVRTALVLKVNDTCINLFWVKRYIYDKSSCDLEKE